MVLPETKIVRNYYGLSWPTLIVSSVVALAVTYAVYHIYIAALAVANQ